MPLRHNFVCQLLGPYQALVAQCAENDLVYEQQNDVIAGASSLAIAAAHFVEANNLDKDDGEAKFIQSSLKDVADTSKHGSLDNPDRTIILRTAYSFEFNDQGQFRFMRRDVLAENARFGEFHLPDALGRYIALLADRLGWHAMRIEPDISLKPFIAEAGLLVTRRTIDAQNINLRFYKRSETGAMLPADPASVTFVIR